MTNLTFNEIPAAIMELNRKIDILLAERDAVPEEDRLMSVEKLIDYMEEKTGKRWAYQTVYDNTTKRKIPFEKYGKYLYFRKSAIDTWLANGRRVE